MNVLIVGGSWGDEAKPSSVITKLGSQFADYGVCEVINGGIETGSIEELQFISHNIQVFDLVLWMAEVSNRETKIYPKTARGAVLIMSKVLREDRTEVDAVTQIFKMNGNAVIAITREKNQFSFKLLDALGNVWVETSDLGELAKTIIKFKKWTNESVRVPTKRFYPEELKEVVLLNKKVADKFKKIKGGCFGNVSTRCLKLFPSARSETSIYVSKTRLDVNEMVIAINKTSGIEYVGTHKPSVDTPIQLAIYEEFPHVNYMIHGHTYAEGAEMTEHYFPCGDMREVEVIRPLIKENGVINLKNHGFLIYSDTIENLRIIVEEVNLIERKVGFEKIEVK